MNQSGQAVSVGDVSLSDNRPVSDFDRLIEYIQGRFGERDSELIRLLRDARSLKLKADLIELGFQAIDYRRELSGWIALARRVRDEQLGDALDQAHGERTLEANAQDLKRAPADLVKARAKQTIAPLNEALERLEAARQEMDTIVSWCQSLQRAISNEEFGDLFESGNVVPARMYSAPIGAALAELSR